MITVSFFKAKTDLEPSSVTRVEYCETIEALLIREVPSYERLAIPDISIALNGKNISPSLWPELHLPQRCHLEIRVEPKGYEWIGYVIAIIAAAYAYTQIPDIPEDQQTDEGKTIYKTSSQNNSAKVYGIIPEIFGDMPRYLDRLGQGFKEFRDNAEWSYYPLSVGIGYYQITKQKLAFTDTSSYGGDIYAQYFEPGEDVSGNNAHRNIYTAPEVGRTSSGALELTQQNDSLSDDRITYDFSGYTITAKFDDAPTAFPFSAGESFKIEGDAHVYLVDEISGDDNETATVRRGNVLSFGFEGLYQ